MVVIGIAGFISFTSAVDVPFMSVGVFRWLCVKVKVKDVARPAVEHEQPDVKPVIPRCGGSAGKITSGSAGKSKVTVIGGSKLSPLSDKVASMSAAVKQIGSMDQVVLAPRIDALAFKVCLNMSRMCVRLCVWPEVIEDDFCCALNVTYVHCGSSQHLFVVFVVPVPGRHPGGRVVSVRDVPGRQGTAA